MAIVSLLSCCSCGATSVRPTRRRKKVESKRSLAKTHKKISISKIVANLVSMTTKKGDWGLGITSTQVSSKCLSKEVDDCYGVHSCEAV